VQHVEVNLPCGLERRGRFLRTARLRPVSGADEAALADAPALAAARVSALLARCVERIGDERASLADVRELFIGDREALLLHLRRLTFGEALTCVLPCPHPGCGETLELPLTIAALLVPPVAEPRAVHETELAGVRVRFRLPTGKAQETAAERARQEPDAALAELVAACVIEVQDANGAPLDALPPPLVAPFGAVLETLDPQAETRVSLTCVTCGTPFEALLDAATLLFAELGPARIFRDVHVLASRYHWSEASILRLSSERRRHYLALIGEEAS
jgi:hypothetical protein